MDVKEFYRLMAPLYDADYANILEDGTRMYAELAREARGPVLEMGCGTGRVLLPCARAGVTITGIELSPDMLAVLRQSAAAEPPEVGARITVLEGDMRCASAGARFALVTAPFRVAAHLLERADQRAWLRNVKRHLLPGGTLLFDVFQFNPEYLVKGTAPVVVDRVDETGCRIRRFDSNTSLTALQIMDVHLEWIKEDPAGEQVWRQKADVRLRWYTKAELENLLELEGFEVLDYWGSFQREPFGAGSEQQIIRARPAI